MNPKEALVLLLETKSQRQIAEDLSSMGVSFTQPAISMFLNGSLGVPSWDVGDALIVLAKKAKRRKAK